MFPSEILTEMERGDQYLSNLNSQLIGEMKRGCSDCYPNGLKCLKTTMNALNLKNNLPDSVYDDTDAINLEIMQKIIGDYTLQTAPTVSAGANQSVGIDNTATFTATIVEGSAPIVSILWSIVSGGGVLTNADEATVEVNGFPLGATVLKVLVVDGNGLSDSDTAILTGVDASTVVNFGWSVTNPFGSENVPTLQQSIEVVDGATEYTLPFNSGANLNYLIVSEPNTFPAKDFYVNVPDVTEGDIPDSRMRIGVVISGRRYYVSRVPFAFDPNSMDLTLKQV